MRTPFIVVAALCAASGCKSKAEVKLDANVDKPAQVRAKPLSPGDTAPDISLLSHTGYQVSLYDLLDKPVAVYFCPAGLTASCASLTTALRDRWLALTPKLGMALIVVPSGWNDNRAFATENELPLLIVSDHDGAATRSFIGATPDTNSTTGYLIAPNRTVAQRYASLDPASHVAALTRALNE